TLTGNESHVIEAGDLTFQSSASGKTYRNTEGGTLDTANPTLTLDVLAEEIGADSNAAAGEIDTLVTTLIGVTATNAAAVVGSDEEDDDDLRQRCRDALAALSPNGAAQAYSFIARSTLRSDGTPVDVN